MNQHSKYLLILLLIQTLNFTGCISENGSSQVEKKIKIPSHSIYNEEIRDHTSKTEITVHAIIEEDSIAESDVKILLDHLYQNTMNRTDFKHRDQPTNAEIYLYSSIEYAQSDMGQWLAVKWSTPKDPNPTIEFKEQPKETQLKQPDLKWGLTTDDRRQIWKELIQAEDRALQEADNKYPPENNLTSSEIKRYTNYNDALLEKYEQNVANKFGIETAIVDSISIEGLVNGWPFPAYN